VAASHPGDKPGEDHATALHHYQGRNSRSARCLPRQVRGCRSGTVQASRGAATPRTSDKWRAKPCTPETFSADSNHLMRAQPGGTDVTTASPG
jgi:hypothetical protein